MSGWIGAWGNAATVTNLTVTGSEVIAVNTSTNALRITQTGSGNALLVEDNTNPDSTAFIIDNAGSVIAGGTTTITEQYGGTAKLTINTFGDPNYALAAATFSNDAYQTIISLLKSRSTTSGGQTIVQQNDAIGDIRFQGSDGVQFIQAAVIQAIVDGVPGTNDMPGRLVFGTTADGASSPTPRMTIDNVGNIYSASGTTGMISGFFYIPAAAGAPSGVPTAISGRVPMYYDTTNNNFYVYNGAWKKVLLA